MSMAEFQFIYWWEWGHRQLGRTLGLVYFLPFVFFLATGRAPKRLQPRLWVLFALGGLQGAIGWWMVSSGLTERLDVSQYRLRHPSHHGVRDPGADAVDGARAALRQDIAWPVARACFLGGAVLGRGVVADRARRFRGRARRRSHLHHLARLSTAAALPQDYLSGMPFWQAIFESRPAVQFQHRWFAYMRLRWAADCSPGAIGPAARRS
jgi:cytochrome c oxidase assembly protein subunit 15